MTRYDYRAVHHSSINQQRSRGARGMKPFDVVYVEFCGCILCSNVWQTSSGGLTSPPHKQLWIPVTSFLFPSHCMLGLNVKFLSVFCIEIDVCTVCAPERENAGSRSGAVLLCTHWQPSNCRAIVHTSYIAGHHILLIFEANY